MCKNWFKKLNYAIIGRKEAQLQGCGWKISQQFLQINYNQHQFCIVQDYQQLANCDAWDERFWLNVWPITKGKLNVLPRPRLPTWQKIAAVPFQLHQHGSVQTSIWVRAKKTVAYLIVLCHFVDYFILSANRKSIIYMITPKLTTNVHRRHYHRNIYHQSQLYAVITARSTLIGWRRVVGNSRCHDGSKKMKLLSDKNRSWFFYVRRNKHGSENGTSNPCNDSCYYGPSFLIIQLRFMGFLLLNITNSHLIPKLHC